MTVSETVQALRDRGPSRDVWVSIPRLLPSGHIIREHYLIKEVEESKGDVVVLQAAMGVKVL